LRPCRGHRRRFVRSFRRGGVNARSGTKARLWPDSAEGYGGEKNHLKTGFPPKPSASGFGRRRTSDRESELCRWRRSEGFVVRLDDGQHRVCLVCGNAAALPSAYLRGAAPHPSSAQSPHRSEHPAGKGIPNSASLRLLFKRNPLRWAFVWF